MTREEKLTIGSWHDVRFDGCPNAKDTLDNLKEVLKELEIPEKEIEILEIPDLQKAEKFKFQGSPTILIDGLDIYLMQVPEGFSYTCRIYNFKGGNTPNYSFAPPPQPHNPDQEECFRKNLFFRIF